MATSRGAGSKATTGKKKPVAPRAPTPPPPPVDTDPSVGGGALSAGDRACGLERIREGFAESAAYDRLFALGWPKIVLTGGETPTLDERVALAGVGVMRRRVWPAAVLGPLVRFWTAPSHVAYGMDAHGRGGTYDDRGRPMPSAQGLAILDEEMPLGVAEAERLLGELVGRSWGEVAILRNVLRVVEAAIGSAATVDIVVRAMEAWPPEVWTGTRHLQYHAVLEVSALFDRVTSKERSAVTDRLERVFERVVRDAFGADVPPLRGAAEHAPPLRPLDVVLHGVEGAKRSGIGVPKHPIGWSELGWIRDGGDLILDAMKSGRATSTLPDVRRVFEGGEETLDIEARTWRTIEEADDQRVMIDTYGVLASPRIVGLFLDMAANSKVKAEARAWFERRREFARPELERLARGRGQLAAEAEKLSAQIGAQRSPAAPRGSAAPTNRKPRG